VSQASRRAAGHVARGRETRHVARHVLHCATRDRSPTLPDTVPSWSSFHVRSTRRATASRASRLRVVPPLGARTGVALRLGFAWLVRFATFTNETTGIISAYSALGKVRRALSVRRTARTLLMGSPTGGATAYHRAALTGSIIEIWWQVRTVDASRSIEQVSVDVRALFHAFHAPHEPPTTTQDLTTSARDVALNSDFDPHYEPAVVRRHKGVRGLDGDMG
jgi:hypothetical protein